MPTAALEWQDDHRGMGWEGAATAALWGYLDVLTPVMLFFTCRQRHQACWIPAVPVFPVPSRCSWWLGLELELGLLLAEHRMGLPLSLEPLWPPLLGSHCCGASPREIPPLSPWLPQTELQSILPARESMANKIPHPICAFCDPTWELNYVLSGAVIHFPFPEMKPKYFPFLLAQLRLGWSCSCSPQGAHPGTGSSAPSAEDKQEPAPQSPLAQAFCTSVPLYQSIESQNSLQIQGVEPSTTKKLQPNSKSIFPFSFHFLNMTRLPSLLYEGAIQSIRHQNPFPAWGGLWGSFSWKEMKPFLPG